MVTVTLGYTSWPHTYISHFGHTAFYLAMQLFALKVYLFILIIHNTLATLWQYCTLLVHASTIFINTCAIKVISYWHKQ